MKNILTSLSLLLSALLCAAQTQSKQYITSTGDTVSATATTTPSTLNYATLSLSGNTVTLNQATMTQGSTYLNLVVHPKVTAPAYIPSGPITLQSNMTYSGLNIDMGNASTVGITGNNVTNVHITNCRIVNTKNFAILLNGCSNITIDNCFISNVGFGVYAQSGSKQIKVNNNQFLNINGINTSFLGHAVQFNAVNGGGNQINYNRIENIKNITDTSSHPHDQINVYQSNGIVGDSIQVIGNWIRGGQITAWPNSGATGCGIACGDASGSYQVIRNNILISTGCAGIQCIQQGIGIVSSIKIDHNIIYNNLMYQTAADGIVVLGTVSNIPVNYNRVYWVNKYGHVGIYSGGETSFWGGGSFPPTGVTMIGNKWFDTTLNSSILPQSLITWQ